MNQEDLLDAVAKLRHVRRGLQNAVDVYLGVVVGGTSNDSQQRGVRLLEEDVLEAASRHRRVKEQVEGGSSTRGAAAFSFSALGPKVMKRCVADPGQ